MIMYEENQYSFDVDACYADPLSLIRLPDGRILQVTLWQETYPPSAAEVEVYSGDHRDAVEATLIS